MYSSWEFMCIVAAICLTCGITFSIGAILGIRKGFLKHDNSISALEKKVSELSAQMAFLQGSEWGKLSNLSMMPTSETIGPQVKRKPGRPPKAKPEEIKTP